MTFNDLPPGHRWSPPRGTPGGKPELPSTPVEGFVYFIQAGHRGPVKIGWALDPYRRLGELQIGATKALRLIGLAPGTRKDERRLHADVAQHRIRGEWFALPAKTCTEIRQKWPARRA